MRECIIFTLLVEGIEEWIDELTPLGSSENEVYLHLRDNKTGTTFAVRRVP